MLEFRHVIFLRQALEYPFGRELYDRFKGMGKEVKIIAGSRLLGPKNEECPAQIYYESKRTLFVTVRRSGSFEPCRPSAHYQLPLVSGCTGMCEYCYLSTRTGIKPIARLYANIDDILHRAADYAAQRQPKETLFEASATSDPVVFEPFSGVLSKAVVFFGAQPNARLRFATKFTAVESLLSLNHGGRTSVRFSVNTDAVVSRFEHNTPGVQERIAAAEKVSRAGYETGFMIAPVILHENWENGYKALLDRIKDAFGAFAPITFEIVTHRFTANSKNAITQIFPNTALDMDEANRRFKFGQFGYGKYVYRDEDMKRVKAFFEENIGSRLGNARILYMV